jgi:hypothetical protein
MTDIAARDMAATRTLEGTVRAAATGDEAAFARLVAEHHPAMARVAYVICGDAGPRATRPKPPGRSRGAGSAHSGIPPRFGHGSWPSPPTRLVRPCVDVDGSRSWISRIRSPWHVAPIPGLAYRRAETRFPGPEKVVAFYPMLPHGKAVEYGS